MTSKRLIAALILTALMQSGCVMKGFTAGGGASDSQPGVSDLFDTLGLEPDPVSTSIGFKFGGPAVPSVEEGTGGLKYKGTSVRLGGER